MMQFTEVEFKYEADEISLARFKKKCLSLRPIARTFPASYDHYYDNRKRVLRYRAGDKPELTTKQKTSKHNNYNRKEVNLPISRKATLETVTELAGMLGLKKNFSIYKQSYIYWYEQYNVVYYVVYTDSTRSVELDRFIEIELDEHYDWESPVAAWKKLLEIEKSMKSLGIRPSRRLKKSLYERYG